MAKRVQRRRGTTAEHSSFTGAVGEISVDTTKDTIAVHDGSQAGGFPLAREDMNNVTNRIGITQLNCSDGSANQFLKTNGSGTLSFATVDATTAAVGGDLSGTVGNAQIVSNSITTTELAPAAVANVNIADNTITRGKILNGTLLNDDISGTANIAGSKLAASTITSTQILDGTIVAGDLASNAVTAIKILDGNVTTAKLADNAVTTDKILNDSITSAKIITSNITTSKIATNAVTATQLAANAVTTVKIIDDAVTSAKIATTTLASLNAYDIAFTAGFDKDMVKEDIAVATYGELVMARAGTIIGEAGYIDTAPTGAVVTVDIQKNGTPIYGSGQYPTFAINANSLTTGTLTGSGSGVAFVSGDRITFKIVGIGSAEPGEGLRFTLKCKLTE